MSTLIGTPDWFPQRSSKVERLRKELNDALQREALQVRAAIALAGAGMEGLNELDELRWQLAGQDPVKHKLLAMVEDRAAKTIGRIQDRQLGWEV
jgi:hypothetical protein